MTRWISVTDKLPKEGVRVLCKRDGKLYDDYRGLNYKEHFGEIIIAKIKKGISISEREKMERGELKFSLVGGWCLSDGFTKSPRYEMFDSCDEFGNNLVPYKWIGDGIDYWGQEITKWKPLGE
jgi:hypothetical protein